MEFHATEEIAQTLKVTKTTVERWLAGGKLNGVKVGKRWLVTPQELEAFIQGKMKEGGTK